LVTLFYRKTYTFKTTALYFTALLALLSLRCFAAKIAFILALHTFTRLATLLEHTFFGAKLPMHFQLQYLYAIAFG
jgi:hypothetical protein